MVPSPSPCRRILLGCCWALAWVSPGQGIEALLQTRGTPLRPGLLRGGAQVPLERAVGGETPILTFSAPRGRLRLLLDTGAAAALVTPAAVDRLGLPVRPLAPETFSLAGGGMECPTLRLASTRLPELRLAPSEERPPLRLMGLEALVIPGAALPPGVDGVLGAPTLRQIPLAVDPIAAQVWLGPPALRWRQARSAQPRVVPLRWRRGVPLLPVVIRSRSNGALRTVEALADTGAEGLFLTPALASQLTPVQASQPARLTGVCGLQAARRQTLLGIGIGSPGAAPQGANAILLENPVFALLGVEAIVGQDLLGVHRQLWRLDADPPRLELW